VPCVGSLIGIVSFGFLIAGFVMMIIGSRIFPASHRMMVLVSMVGLVVLFVASMVIGIVGVFAVGIGSFLPGKNLTGRDIIDSLEAMRTLALVTLIPTILTMAIYSLPFFGVSKTWGKGLLVAFMIAVPVASGISFVMKDAAIDDAIGAIDPDAPYEVEDFTDVTNDLTADMFPSTIVSELPMLLLIIAVVGSLLFVNALRSEAQRSLPPMEKTIENILEEPATPALVDPTPIEPESVDNAATPEYSENN
jgi:hypothetical protein